MEAEIHTHMKDTPDALSTDVSRRRTFAIISHPDAGKTTLTEKLLLYGDAIHLAGAVKRRGGNRQTSSDWMEIERQRGISVSTSVLQFTYRGYHLNLLDTPGHNDFCEDTYRTLAAADAAIMLIDSAKGVEPQTVKLFQVCRMRQIPILTLVNKMDRNGREPLALLDEIERVLGIPCSPITWPIGAGQAFQGVYDRWSRQVMRFDRADSGARKADVTVSSLEQDALRSDIGEHAYTQLGEELALLDTAGTPWDRERFLRGDLTPVFFGSALTNFGIEPFLDRFLVLAPPPRSRSTLNGELDANSPNFSGFVFKIQANLDPRHRDRVAFVRICSGRFVRGMKVRHPRTGMDLTLSKPFQFLAQERTLIDEAVSGDVIGLWDNGQLRIGDTLCAGPMLEFPGIPRFSPEHFVRVRLTDPFKRKQLQKGLAQLAEEGTVQLFFDRSRLTRDPILGAVGPLQFEIVRHRLAAEYGAVVDFVPLLYQYARWIQGERLRLDDFELSGRSTCLRDTDDRPLVLFADAWALRQSEETHEHLQFLAAVRPPSNALPAA
ncbi:MAG: peptide chain release factor 3 [Candidatus Binataceae bacterium]